jgi:NAD(P)-dependent dehydrogenase (short-subunit alcohol dehydrogenase family)
MPTIAIIGAGPGMGLAIAQTFGKEGTRSRCCRVPRPSWTRSWPN